MHYGIHDIRSLVSAQSTPIPPTMTPMTATTRPARPPRLPPADWIAKRAPDPSVVPFPVPLTPALPLILELGLTVELIGAPLVVEVVGTMVVGLTVTVELCSIGCGGVVWAGGTQLVVVVVVG